MSGSQMGSWRDA